MFPAEVVTWNVGRVEDGVNTGYSANWHHHYGSPCHASDRFAQYSPSMCWSELLIQTVVWADCAFFTVISG